MENKNIFISNLKKLLNEKNITQKQIAKALKIDQSSISYLLNGITTPKFTTLISIADYFGVSLDWLCGRTDKREEFIKHNHVANIGNG